MAANSNGATGNGGSRSNNGGVYNDPEVYRSYIGQYPSSDQFGETSRRYTYLDTPQRPPQPSQSQNNTSGNSNPAYGANIGGQIGGNRQSVSAQKPSMQAWLNNTTDYAPSYYISYGSARRQN